MLHVDCGLLRQRNLLTSSIEFADPCRRSITCSYLITCLQIKTDIKLVKPHPAGLSTIGRLVSIQAQQSAVCT